MKKLIFKTSNKEKIEEVKNGFNKYIEFKKGKDFPEIIGSKEEVILYKTLLAKPNTIIEDTIITLENKEIINIKWEKDNLQTKEKKESEWIVSLGLKKGNNLYFVIEIIKGQYGKPEHLPKEDYFSFDPYFFPNEAKNKSLHELKIKGKKDLYSARYRAFDRLLKGDYNIVIENYKNNIEKFKGEFQNNYTIEDFINKYNLSKKEIKNFEKFFIIDNNKIIKEKELNKE